MGTVVDAQDMFRNLANRMRMWMAGIQFHGQRDLYEVFGWNRRVDYRNFIASYYRQGMAKRVVDAPVLGCWTDPPTLQADNEEFNIAFQEIIEEQALWFHVIRLDKLAGLGKYAVMVVGFDDGADLAAPIIARPGANVLREVIYLQPYHEGACQILEYEEDKSNPRFGQPVMYEINPGRFVTDGSSNRSTLGSVIQLRQPFKCHYSRLVQVAENLLEDGTYGCSRLESVFNDLCDLLKVSGGSAETFWLIVNRGMQLDIDKDIDVAPEDMDELKREVEEYQHHLRRFMRTRGVKITELGAHPVDPQNVFKMIVQCISAGTGIPQLVLTGASIGQISSRNDRSNWADRIAERIAEYANPVILKRLLDCFINAGALPKPVNLQITWPEAFKMDPLERGQTSAQMARSAVNLMKAHLAGAQTDETGNLIAPQPLFTPLEMRNIVGFGRHPPVFDSPIPQGDVGPPGTAEDPTLQKGGAAGTVGPGGAAGPQ